MWGSVKEQALNESVAPLVAFVARGHLPSAERLWCDQVLARSWTDHEKNLRDLDTVLAMFDAAAVPVISLKGPLLARRHYNPPFLRKRSRDIDVAVRDCDIERAIEALGRAGYTSPESLRESRLRNHHIAFLKPGHPRVEVHFRLTHGAFGIPVEEFFGRAIPAELPSGRAALVLGAADELMHLILHFGSGRCVSLFHMYEVRRVWMAAPSNVRREAVDRATRHHFAGALHLTDLAFRTRWGEGLFPPDLPLRETWLHRWVNEDFYQAFQRCHQTPVTEQTLPERIRTRWLDLRLTDTPTDALRLAGTFSRAALFQVTAPWK